MAGTAQMRNETEREQAFQALIASAANKPLEKPQAVGEEEFPMTVAEVLAIGRFEESEPTVAVIRNTEGQVWILYESPDIEGGLSSRWEVRPGMRVVVIRRTFAEARTRTRVVESPR